MKLIYQVFSADPVTIIRPIEVDGEETEVSMPGLSVQLTAKDHGTIILSLSAAQAKGHPFVVGQEVVVDFYVNEEV